MADEWNVSLPADSLAVADIPSKFRANKTNIIAVLEHEHENLGDGNTGGEHLNGSAVAYQGTSTPSNRPDGSTALASNDIDKGRFWLDDNYDPPVLKRWDGSAFEVLGRYLVDAAQTVLILHNEVHEDADNGRESRIVAYGEQSGGERTTLGWLEFSHEGTGDDQKGQFLIKLNDGDDSDAPSKVPIHYNSDGTVDVTDSVSVLDEDDMASDSATQLATQQSIKKFVEDEDAADHPAYSGGQSHTDGSNLITKMGYIARSGTTTTLTFGSAFPNALVGVSVTAKYNSVANAPVVNTLSVSGFAIYCATAVDGYYWIAIGH